MFSSGIGRGATAGRSRLGVAGGDESRSALARTAMSEFPPFRLDTVFLVSQLLAHLDYLDEGGDARTRAPPGSWHRPSAVRVWRFWLDDRITRLESLRCSLRSSLGPRTEHAREPGEADRTPTRAASGGTGIG